MTQDIKYLNLNENHIILGDCLEVMKLIPSKSVHLICSDLPYGKTKNSKDIRIAFPPLWEQYKRIIKDDGVILLFAQGTFYVDLVDSNRKMFRYDIIWDKVLTTGFLNAKKMPLRSHEQIAVFYKKCGTYNPQFTEGKPLHGKGHSFKDKTHINQNYGEFKQLDDVRKGSTQKYPKSIITVNKPHPSKAKHRTAKPVDLLVNLIKQYSNENDIVLDNCAGSGSLGHACITTNRKYILIEKDISEYNKIKLNG
jgi:site-specific DNA-methyltransferase (adenine-specific)